MRILPSATDYAFWRHPCFHVAAPLRAVTGWVLWGLLAGYLIVNRSFASLGFPPLYIGEIVLACVVLSLIERTGAAFIEPLRRSWAFRLIALFCLYGGIRALTAYPVHGWWALRDSVIATYAAVAFIAPAAWSVLVRPRAAALPGNANATAELETAFAALPSHVATMLLPLSALAALFSASMLYGWINPDKWPQNKVDFLSISAAVAAWVWAVAAVKMWPWARTSAVKKWLQTACSVVAAAAALACLHLLHALPMRTMWLSVGPLAALTVVVWAYTPMRQRALFAASAGLLLAGVFVMGGRMMQTFCKYEAEWALADKLDFSSDRLEQYLRLYPGKYDRLVLRRATTGDAEAEKERWRSLWDPDAKNFKTQQGQLGAHAVMWRATFWLRCWHYTMSRAPVFGIGLGTNLTYLLRNTPAWPIFIDSVRLDPPNRNPHCAHVTIFTRLGLLGLALWLGILGTVCVCALRTCWYHRQRASSPDLAPEEAALHRTHFWDGVTVLGVWLIYLWAMSFGVVLEGPFGGIWFWALTGVLAWWSIGTSGEPRSEPQP